MKGLLETILNSEIYNKKYIKIKYIQIIIK